MPMKTLIIILPFLLLTSQNFAQCTKGDVNKIRKKIENRGSKTELQDSVLQKLKINNDLIVGYSKFNTTWMHVPSQYFLFAFNKNGCIGYHYIIKKNSINNEKPLTIDSVIIPNQIASMILTTIVNNKAWEIKRNENDSTNIFCVDAINKFNCQISDASYKSLILLTKSSNIVSTFYAPEYFENECCPGNKDRQTFIKCYNVLYGIIKN